MSGKDGGTGHIIQSLVVNSLIAAAKGVAAFFTGSGAMLAEAIHSAADCGNQLLLLRGVKEGKRPADARHPLGYGRNVYFWSFMVALLLFSGGGMFSIYEGVHKLQHPEAVENVTLAIVILGFALVLESWATYGNIKELGRRRGTKPFFAFLKDTKDSDLVVVFGENSAAVLGLAIALIAILIAYFFEMPRADAIGTICVGVVLIGVAVFLAVEVKSLLVGEAADAEITAAVEKLVKDDARITGLKGCVTMQQGPGEVVVALKICCEPHLTAQDLSTLINDFEGKLRSARPECRFVFVEPDLSPVPARVDAGSPAVS